MPHLVCQVLGVLSGHYYGQERSQAQPHEQIAFLDRPSIDTYTILIYNRCIKILNDTGPFLFLHNTSRFISRILLISNQQFR
jgi:hypothetical protein